MATLEQIGAALKKAHAAGDAENARKLAAAYQAAKASAAGPASVPDAPPESAAPGSRAYADWAMARVKAGKDVPQVGPAPPEDFTHDLGSKFNAAYTGAVEAVPIAGPALLDAAQKGRAFFQGVPVETIQKETDILQEANPGSTLAGQVTGTVAPFVLASTVPVVSTILGMDTAAPLGMQMIAGAGSSKVISELDTLARGGDPDATVDIGVGEAKPSDIAGIAGAAGPVVGMLAGKGAALIGDKVVDPIARTVGGWVNPEGAAEKALGRSVAADLANGSGLTAADEAAAATYDQPLMNVDRFGTSTRSLARTAANSDPVARETMSDIAQDRFLTQNDRAKSWVQQNTGGPTDVYAIQQQIDSAAKGVNKAAYSTAYNQAAAQNMWTPELQQLMQSANVQRAVKTALKTSAEEAALSGSKPLQNPFIFDQINGTVKLRQGAAPTLEFWDHVQRALRRRAAQLSRNPDAEFDVGQVVRARQQLNEILDTTVPEFAMARGGAARWFGAEDALEAGRNFATTKPSDMAEAAAAINKFTPTEKRLFASGFAASLIDKIESTPNTTDVINKVFGSPQARAQIEAAMGTKAAQELEPFLRVENALRMTKRAIQGGSNTAQQLAAMGVLGAVSGGVTGSGGSFNPLAWNPAHMGSGAGLAMMGRYGAKQLGISADQKVMQELARLLSSSDPKLVEQAVRNATRSSKSADALKAIEYGLSVLTRTGAASAAKDAALEEEP